MTTTLEPAARQPSAKLSCKTVTTQPSGSNQATVDVSESPQSAASCIGTVVHAVCRVYRATEGRGAGEEQPKTSLILLENMQKLRRCSPLHLDISFKLISTSCFVFSLCGSNLSQRAVSPPVLRSRVEHWVIVFRGENAPPRLEALRCGQCCDCCYKRCKGSSARQAWQMPISVLRMPPAHESNRAFGVKHC